jgi:hypothetical protein
MHDVRISSRSMRQMFHGCEPGYIRDVCHGACCRSTVHPAGISVTIHPSEEMAVRARGADVRDGFIVPVERRCPYQTPVNLCDVHGSDAKPFGCIASPFILTARDTLVVRNRYRLLKCYRDGNLPAYVAFRVSLDLLFGSEAANRIAIHLDGGGGDLTVPMLPTSYRMLTETTAVRHAP